MFKKIVIIVQQLTASFAVALTIAIAVNIGVLVATGNSIFGQLMSPSVILPLTVVAFFFVRRYVVVSIPK
jgi:hypothetical protein